MTKTTEQQGASAPKPSSDGAPEQSARVAELQEQMKALEGERSTLQAQLADAEKRAKAASASEVEAEAMKSELAELRERVAQNRLDEQAVAVDLTKLKDKKVRIKIGFGEGDLGKLPVKIGFGGTFHMTIPRNVEVVVPGFVLGILNDAVEDSYTMGVDPRSGQLRGLSEATPRQRFPYTVLGIVDAG